MSRDDELRRILYGPDDDNAPRFLSVSLPDEYGGSILLAACMHPESSGERWDLALAFQCPEHHRTVYYCDDNGVLWCDGYQGSGDVAAGAECVPHELEVTVGRAIDA